MGANQTIQRKKDGKSRDPFVALRYRWMDTPAWAHLTGNAVKLLVLLIRLSGGDNGSGNDRGELFLSERDAAKAMGVARNTASSAFDRLIETGWVAPVTKGSFNVKCGEQVLRATVWRLTFQPHPQSRRGPTMDFMNWHPDENQRAQKLNGTGAEIEPLSDSERETGAEIEPVVINPPSEGENTSHSEIEPHLDTAIGTRVHIEGQNSGRPIATPKAQAA